jgi:hypothetical protein
MVVLSFEQETMISKLPRKNIEQETHLIVIAFFKTCKAHFSLREESFTRRNFRRTPKEHELPKRQTEQEKKERGSPHHRYRRKKAYANNKHMKGRNTPRIQTRHR